VGASIQGPLEKGAHQSRAQRSPIPKIPVRRTSDRLGSASLAQDVPFQDLWNCERWLAGDSRVDLPADFRELVAWLQSNKANVGTAGVGSASHVSGLAVQSIAGTELALVSYRSAGAAIQDLAAGHIDLMFDQVSNSMPQIRAYAIKAFAVTRNSRFAEAPDIPTERWSGYPTAWLSRLRLLLHPPESCSPPSRQS